MKRPQMAKRNIFRADQNLGTWVKSRLLLLLIMTKIKNNSFDTTFIDTIPSVYPHEATLMCLMASL
jgi:hypothetical protein